MSILSTHFHSNSYFPRAIPTLVVDSSDICDILSIKKSPVSNSGGKHEKINGFSCICAHKRSGKIGAAIPTNVGCPDGKAASLSKQGKTLF